jgi:hypothetical protein
MEPSTKGEPQENVNMIARRIFEPQIPESVAQAYDGVQSLVARDKAASLEELQGAVEYLLDRVKAARGLDGSTGVRFN